MGRYHSGRVARLTCVGRVLSFVRAEPEIARKIRSWERSGFDPQPYLERLDIPALWLFGGDRNVPPVQGAALLRSIKRDRGKDWTIVLYPGAGHGLFDTPPTDPRATPAAEAWVRRHVHTWARASLEPSSLRPFVPMLIALE